MAKVKGICRNEECEICDEIQEVEKSNFVCEKCGRPLMPFGGAPKPGWFKLHGKQMGIIGGAAVVLIGGGIGLYSILKSDPVSTASATRGGQPAADSVAAPVDTAASNEAEHVVLTLNKSQLSLQEGASEQLTLSMSGEGAAAQGDVPATWVSDNPSVASVDNSGNVKALKAGTAKITVQIAGTQPVASAATCEVIVAQKSVAGATRTATSAPRSSASSGINLGYGIYKGDVKDGKPHGHGVITYTRSHKIVSSQDFVAQPGDRFEGDFRDGRIASIGYWYHDGNQTAVKP